MDCNLLVLRGEGRRQTMDYAVSHGGLLVHARKDWPCAVCRPEGMSEGRGFWLCAHCAHGMIVAAEAGMEGARALLPEVADALFSLEGQSLEPGFAVN
jgi:ribosomal protein L37AE/L43A